MDKELFDHTGRIVTTAEHLQELVHAASDFCLDCDEVHFGGVYWHERDHTGCNWSVAVKSGEPSATCLSCLVPIAMSLRKTYSLPDAQAYGVTLP